MALSKEYRFVKPREGCIVRYPRTYTILPEIGGVVPWVGADGRYWRRRLKVGDVEITYQKTETEEIPKIKFRKNSREEEGRE